MPTHYQGAQEEVQALNTFIKLTRATSAFETRMLSHGTLGDITISQFGVLESLYHLGTMCQGTLSQKVLKSTGNITLVLDNLEKRGMVRRVRSAEDRRMIMIELLPAGKEWIEKVLPKHVQAIAEEMSVLTAEEQVELARLCRKLGLGKNAFTGCLSEEKKDCETNREPIAVEPA